MNSEYERIRDFLIAHYKLTERDDTPFWNACRAMEVPDTVAARFDVFENDGLVLEMPHDLFKENNWFSVLVGQGLYPRTYHPLADALPRDEFLKRMTELRRMILQRASALPPHAQYIDHLRGKPS